MELLAQPDFFESYDFNFLTTEIFHTQEKEFDDTLTDGERLQLEWLHDTKDKDFGPNESLTENQNPPIFAANASENTEVKKNSTASLDGNNEANQLQ